MSEPVAKKLKIMPEVVIDTIVGSNEQNGTTHNGGTKMNGNGAKEEKKEKKYGDGSKLFFKKLSSDAYMPIRGSANAAGIHYLYR